MTIELTEDAARWLADKGYDEKYGARPLARTIQEHIKKPLAEELLFGKLEHGGAVRVIVEQDGLQSKLGFEFFPAEPSRKGKSDDDDDDDGDDDQSSEKALIEATPRKALPGPKEKKPRAASKSSTAVPTVPPKKNKTDD